MCENLPIVFMHGIMSSTRDNDVLLSFVREMIPNVDIINCEVGNGRVDSVFMSMQNQVEELSNCINNDKRTAGGFIALGYS